MVLLVGLVSLIVLELVPRAEKSTEISAVAGHGNQQPRHEWRGIKPFADNNGGAPGVEPRLGGSGKRRRRLERGGRAPHLQN